MIKKFVHSFQEMTSVENLLTAWREFLPGKANKKDVQTFESRFFNNILTLYEELASKKYIHGGYYRFNIADPKPRIIHKATVRDRLLHHAIHRVLYPLFEKTFTADSFSCQIDKGVHRAINRFRYFAYKVSNNHTQTCWILKCDIKKFFNSIDHGILLNILKLYISDQDIVWLLRSVIASFSVIQGKGLPLGNLTSQLLVNIYMNEFDLFMKHKIKAQYYIRYADDFAILSRAKVSLISLIPTMDDFLKNNLKLSLHPEKVYIKTLASGVDFLGWVHFTDHRVLRTATKRRMFKRLEENTANEILQSYLGLLRHGNAYKLQKELLDLYQ